MDTFDEYIDQQTATSKNDAQELRCFLFDCMTYLLVVDDMLNTSVGYGLV